MPDIDDIANSQINDCLAMLREIFSENLLAVYLYGSAVYGGLARYSDLDIFVLLNSASSAEEQVKLTHALLNISGVYMKSDKRPIELTMVQKSEINPWKYPPVFDYQYGEWLRQKFESKSLQPSINKEMPDLALLVTQLHLASQTLIGETPKTLLCKVPYKDFIKALTAELPNMLPELESDTRNVLLKLTRVWGTVESNLIYSKPGAAAWALNRLPEKYQAVIERARAICVGEVDEQWDDLSGLITPCAEYMLSIIHESMEQISLSENISREIRLA